MLFLYQHKHIERFSNLHECTFNHDPTDIHIKKVKEWADKLKDRGGIAKAWQDYILNDEA